MAVKKSKIKKDYTGVLLEEVHSNFKLVIENLDYMRKKGDATFEAVGVLQEDMTMVKTDVAILKKDMVEVKGELHVIRNELKEKVGRDEFKLLENRVARLEKTTNLTR